MKTIENYKRDPLAYKLVLEDTVKNELKERMDLKDRNNSMDLEKVAGFLVWLSSELRHPIENENFMTPDYVYISKKDIETYLKRIHEALQNLEPETDKDESL